MVLDVNNCYTDAIAYIQLYSGKSGLILLIWNGLITAFILRGYIYCSTTEQLSMPSTPDYFYQGISANQRLAGIDTKNKLSLVVLVAGKVTI